MDTFTLLPQVELAPKLNKQLWENSILSGSTIDVASEEGPDALFNQKKPNLAVLSEKPEHRLMILLKSEGHSNREIAKLTGYTEPHVSQVLRQPWARLRIIEEINKGGREAVQVLLASAAVDSVYTVIELRDTAEDESVRLRASQDLLDRQLGKATQHIESRSSVHHVHTEIEKLDMQILDLERQTKLLTGESHSSDDGANP